MTASVSRNPGSRTGHPTDVDRARIRARVGSAARILHATWPLRTFVAVNPLGGLEDHPFEEALGLAGDLLGLRGHPSLERFRAWYGEGRITEMDLAAALRRHLPGVDLSAEVLVAERAVTALDALRLDLLVAEDPTGAAPRRPRGAGEWCDRLLGTDVAPDVDEQVAKWCAAFCDTTQARLAMPGRDQGLYLAWRALVGRDPALRRLGVARARFQRLPERPEDAILAALAALRIPPREHRAELRAQLARLPGFASHIKWRQEHPDQAPHPADLTDLLAIRLTYEAALVDHAAGERLPYGSAGLRALVEEHLDLDGRAAATAEPLSAHARTAAVARSLGLETSRPDELEDLADILATLAPEDRPWVWLDAFEWHYRDQLLTALDRPAPPARTTPPAAQTVFCIDARSEGIRRHLEARGAYETFGFAGFYQLVIRYHTLQSSHDARLCPVPLTPTKTVLERATRGAEEAAAGDVALERHAAALNHAFHDAKDSVTAPFALAEAAGWLAGPLAATKTLAPERYGRVRGALARRAARRRTETTAHTPERDEAEALVAEAERQMVRAFLDRPGLSVDECESLRCGALAGGEPELAALKLTEDAHARRVERALALGYDLEEQLDWAEFALRSFGLVGDFARVVMLAGHGSTTENNAYEAALDCGACGGQRGGPNARIACALLNRAVVREGLAARGIAIPADTWFAAAEHDTAIDRVEILDRHLAPATHAAELDTLQADLDAAGAALAAERAARLPGPDHPHRRSRDWAQVRPEWGLARHAAFIVGPGEIVSGLDLECRTFLHSYDWQADPDASALETILTAPGLVIQWINAQYYFATTDPDVLGAGDKTLHNVIGDIGVLQGHAGDLQLGLPWQSLAAGDELYHEPMRALYIVQAPRERVQTLIERNDLLRHYFDGGWVALAVREGPGEPWQRRTRAGAWEPWQPANTQTKETIA